MSERETDYGREVRDTVIKSGLTGVAATVMAVAVFSPAGLGGMIGTSVASGAGNTAQADDPYANLPPFPAPLTSEEISDIRGQLASTAASLEITRAATEARIEQMRALTIAAPVVSAPVEVHAPVIEAQAAPLNENAQVAHDGGEPAYRDRHQELASLLLSDSL
ncbi:MAG TPA: hypothetical protein PLK37_09965 [Terricaulis sp.]|nr:hypothetical protein [Terricaulis sp.]